MNKIYVYENFTEEAKKIGILYYDIIRGKEIYSFEYDNEWLSSNENKIELDPELPLTRGRHYTNKEIFGLFADASPDRWGRTLMNRREKLMADKEKRNLRKLNSSDYLLGVYDKTRQGALRFKINENEDFVSNDDEHPTPPWTNLRTLELASREFENNKNLQKEKWLNELLQPGSSLGGARPKAVIKDTEENLWIAKFPSKNDTYDIGKWEKIVSDLAKLCDLDVPDTKIEKFSNLGSTFLVKRFDREKDKRIHFASAMTLLNQVDGTNEASYLDIISLIKKISICPNKDLLELWKRIAFNMAVRNTDDHLRNHGFLLTKKGWKLSPLYDVNPNPIGENLSLFINETDSRITKELLLEISPLCNLTLEEAKNLLNNITKRVKENWELIAKSYKLNRNEIEVMREAFSFCEE